MRSGREHRAARHAALVGARVAVMALSGALVAGVRAGCAYNSFPLMNGHWVPPEILALHPWWLNFANNMATVQFDHRVLAMGIALLALSLVWRVERDPRAAVREKRWAWALLAAVALQLAAGISTLLPRVPLPPAALHHARAVAVFTCALGLLHALSRTADLHR